MTFINKISLFVNRHIFTEWINQMKLSYDKQMSEDDTARKNDEMALLWRQRGNIKFRAEMFEESHKLYTKSVLFARKDGPLYSVALANRSAAALRLRRYKVSNNTHIYLKGRKCAKQEVLDSIPVTIL